MVFDHDFKNYPELSNKQMSTLGFSSPHPQITEDFEAFVVKVHDGDTIRLRTTFRDFDFPLRLLGIDAPELNEGGEAARDWLKAKILGRKVQILINKNNRVGKYGRLLGDVVVCGLSVGEEMMHLGLVNEFGKKDASELPDLNTIFRSGQWFQGSLARTG